LSPANQIASFSVRANNFRPRLTEGLRSESFRVSKPKVKREQKFLRFFTSGGEENENKSQQELCETKWFS
jgi:hypothetical protein